MQVIIFLLLVFVIGFGLGSIINTAMDASLEEGKEDYQRLEFFLTQLPKRLAYPYLVVYRIIRAFIKLIKVKCFNEKP